MAYRCKKCGRTFATRKQVRDHIKNEHGVKSGKPYGNKKRRMSPITELHEKV